MILPYLQKCCKVKVGFELSCGLRDMGFYVLREKGNFSRIDHNSGKSRNSLIDCKIKPYINKEASYT